MKTANALIAVIACTFSLSTSAHAEGWEDKPILHNPIEFAPVTIEEDADVGIGAIVLMGVRIGRGAQVGAGAVVTRDVPAFAVCAGVPAKVVRIRSGNPNADLL